MPARIFPARPSANGRMARAVALTSGRHVRVFLRRQAAAGPSIHPTIHPSNRPTDQPSSPSIPPAARPCLVDCPPARSFSRRVVSYSCSEVVCRIIQQPPSLSFRLLASETNGLTDGRADGRGRAPLSFAAAVVAARPIVATVAAAAGPLARPHPCRRHCCCLGRFGRLPLSLSLSLTHSIATRP